MTQATTDAMAEAILSAVREWRGAGCTFASLEKIPGFRDNATLYNPADDCVVIWEGLSAEAIAAIRSLISRGAIHFERSSFEAHRLKIERRRPPPGTFCWRPICLGPGAGEQQRGRR
jgi:hypothetical protein